LADSPRLDRPFPGLLIEVTYFRSWPEAPKFRRKAFDPAAIVQGSGTRQPQRSPHARAACGQRHETIEAISASRCSPSRFST